MHSVSFIEDSELHWSFSLNHGLRLIMPLRLMMAKRVTNQMGGRSDHVSKVSIQAPTP